MHLHFHLQINWEHPIVFILAFILYWAIIVLGWILLKILYWWKVECFKLVLNLKGSVLLIGTIESKVYMFKVWFEVLVDGAFTWKGDEEDWVSVGLLNHYKKICIILFSLLFTFFKKKKLLLNLNCFRKSFNLSIHLPLRC